MRWYPRGLSACIMLFTRLRLPRAWQNPDATGLVRWCFIPALLLGGIQALAAFFLVLLGLDAWLGAFLLWGLPLLLTKAFHLDGFLDCADGLLCDTSPERRRSIMKDSRIGAFAFAAGTALCLGTVLFWHHLLDQGAREYIVLLALAAVALPRLQIPVLAWRAPLAPPAGLGAVLIGHRDNFTLAIHLAFCILPFVLAALAQTRPLLSLGLALACGCHFAALLAWRAWVRRRIGGLSGDVLGAWIEGGSLWALALGALGLAIQGAGA